MEGFFNSILNSAQEIGQRFVSLLPRSPFRQFLGLIDSIPYVEYLNWFLPIDIVCTMLVAWCSAIAVYYLFMIILRWVKAIE